MIHAVLFDLDGTLVDTETISAHAWRRTGEGMQIDIDDDLIRSFVGRTVDAVIDSFMDRCQISRETALEAFSLHQRIKGELMDEELTAKPFAQSTLATLKERGFKLALATSSYRPVVERELAPFNMLPYFDVVTCGDEVTHSKPDPEIYLLAAERLGVDPASCAVVEDSPNGALSGHAAGMPVFLVPDIITPTKEITDCCYEVLGSLHELVGAIALYNDHEA